MRPGILQRRDRRSTLGAVAVEFALVLVLFLNFSVGAIELSNMYTAWTTLQYVCTQAARQMMVADSANASAAAALAAAQAAGNALGYTAAAGTVFTVTQATCPGVSTTSCLTISGSYVYRFKLSTLGMGSITLRARTVAPVV